MTGRRLLTLVAAVGCCASLAGTPSAGAAILSPDAAIVGPTIGVVDNLIEPLQLCVPQLVQTSCGTSELTQWLDMDFPPPPTITGSSTSAPTHVHVALKGASGSGSYDPTLTCGQGGDGPSWSYEWGGPAGLGDPASGGPVSGSASGRLNGTWVGAFEVHDTGHLDTAAAGSHGAGFAPTGAQSIQLNTSAGGVGGTLRLAATGATPSCAAPDLALTASGRVGDGVTAATTSAIPMTLTDATGLLAGTTGSGSLSIASMTLGAGAQNAASLAFDGTLTAASPDLAIGQPVATWATLADWVKGTLTVEIPVANLSGAGVGTAFDVTVGSASVRAISTMGSLGPPQPSASSALPVTVGELLPGTGATVTVKFPDAIGYGAQEALTVSVTGTDAVGGSVGPVTTTRDLVSPLAYLP